MIERNIMSFMVVQLSRAVCSPLLHTLVPADRVGVSSLFFSCSFHGNKNGNKSAGKKWAAGVHGLLSKQMHGVKCGLTSLT